MTSIPFDPPTILVGQRKTGLVIVPDAEESEADPLDLSWNATASGSSLTDTDTTNTNGRAALRRRASLNGNILHVPDRKESYFMQRKIGKTAYGSVRVGFLLETNLDDSGLSGYMSTEYDVVRSDGPYPFEMVAIKVYDQKKMDDEGEGAQTELAALEMIAKAENGGAASLFVQYSHCVCADSNSVYVIVPFHGEGTLFQYVVESGTLSEPVARHYFQQILKVRLCNTLACTSRRRRYFDQTEHFACHPSHSFLSSRASKHYKTTVSVIVTLVWIVFAFAHRIVPSQSWGPVCGYHHHHHLPCCPLTWPREVTHGTLHQR